MNSLEHLIGEIKFNGFDKIKQEIEDKKKIKMIIQNRVDTLKNQLKVYNSQKKLFGNENTKLLNETNLFNQLGQRAHRDLYFISKSNPSLQDDINNVKD